MEERLRKVEARLVLLEIAEKKRADQVVTVERLVDRLVEHTNKLSRIINAHTHSELATKVQAQDAAIARVVAAVQELRSRMMKKKGE